MTSLEFQSPLLAKLPRIVCTTLYFRVQYTLCTHYSKYTVYTYTVDRIHPAFKLMIRRNVQIRNFTAAEILCGSMPNIGTWYEVPVMYVILV